MSHLDEIFISPHTEMAEKVPSYEEAEQSQQTPEPKSPNEDGDEPKDERTEVIYNEPSKENDNNNSLSPKSAAAGSDNHLDIEEEKDSLYDVLAPKQSINSQMNEVVESVPNQNNIIVVDENGDESQPLAYGHSSKRSMDFANSQHLNLKSTLKKDQRAWIDPWEAAVQDTFYHKEIKDLRPTFEVVTSTIKGVESLRNLFEQQPIIAEDNEIEENPDDIELEEEEKAMAEKPKSMFSYRHLS